VGCICGGGGKPDPEVCGGGGSGKALLLALGGGVLAAVRVLDADWRGLGLRMGLGGGGTACNTTCTGLGTSVGGGALSQNEWSGGSPAVTWIVCGTNPSLEIVTAWDCDATAMAQGVKQVWPCPVRASAPGGSDSNRKVCICGPDGFDDIQSGIDGVIQSGIAEQPASEIPTTAAAATTSPTRDMTLSVPKNQIVSRLITPVKPAGG
jgi:hypothetical protein